MADWISVTEAAREFGYNPEHLRALIRAGKVKAKKIVAVWLVDRVSLAAYIRATRKRGEKTGRKTPG